MFLTFLKSIDHFGLPINLHFNQKDKFQTKLGGLASLFYFSIILVYLSFQINALFNRSYTKEQQSYF